MSIPAYILCVQVPVRIESVLNKRQSWRASLKRKSVQRDAARIALGPDIRGPRPPYIITLTRIAPRALDSDNLAAGFKHVRDGVADWLGIDDGDARLEWRYEQRRGRPKEYAAEVMICARVEAAVLDCEHGTL